MNPKRKWQITITEEQMCLMINALEDWHRFVSGDCQLFNATSFIEPIKTMHEVREILDRQVKPLMFPELSYGQNYSWCGGHPDPHLNKAQAVSYMLCREMRHQLTIANPPAHWSVYQSPTLMCEEQGELIKVEPLKE